jgi:hypothetical protein
MSERIFRESKGSRYFKRKGNVMGYDGKYWLCMWSIISIAVIIIIMICNNHKKQIIQIAMENGYIQKIEATSKGYNYIIWVKDK